MNATEKKIEKLVKKLTRHIQVMYENWEEYCADNTVLEMTIEEQEMREELARLRAELP